MSGSETMLPIKVAGFSGVDHARANRIRQGSRRVFTGRKLHLAQADPKEPLLAFDLYAFGIDARRETDRRAECVRLPSDPQPRGLPARCRAPTFSAICTSRLRIVDREIEIRPPSACLSTRSAWAGSSRFASFIGQRPR